jgi:hypothetical protein
MEGVVAAICDGNGGMRERRAHLRGFCGEEDDAGRRTSTGKVRGYALDMLARRPDVGEGEDEVATEMVSSETRETTQSSGGGRRRDVLLLGPDSN